MKRFLSIAFALLLPAFALAGGVVGIFPWQITSPTNGQVLTYVTADGKWENAAASGGGGTVTNTAGALTLNAVVVGNGSADIKVTGVAIDASNNVTGINSLSVASFTPATIVWGTNVLPAVNIGGAGSSQTANYTTVIGDTNSTITHPSSDNNTRTFTIAANASVAYPTWCTLTFVNLAAATLTLAINSDTLTEMNGIGNVTTVSIAANHIATAQKISSTQWILNVN